MGSHLMYASLLVFSIWHTYLDWEYGTSERSVLYRDLPPRLRLINNAVLGLCGSVFVAAGLLLALRT